MSEAQTGLLPMLAWFRRKQPDDGFDKAKAAVECVRSFARHVRADRSLVPDIRTLGVDRNRISRALFDTMWWLRSPGSREREEFDDVLQDLVDIARTKLLDFRSVEPLDAKLLSRASHVGAIPDSLLAKYRKQWLADIKREMSLVPIEDLSDPISPQVLDAREWNALRDKWMKLRSDFREGDTFYEYVSPPKTWELLMGRAGIALVREGEVIAHIVTMMN